MRFSRLPCALVITALLAALPALGQTTPLPAAPTLTPPGSSTAVPLMPGTGTAGTATSPLSLPAAPMTGGFSGGLSQTPSLPYPNLGMPSLPGTGQSSDLSSVLSGSSSLPLTLTLAQLDSNWRRMTITGDIDFGDGTQVISALLGSAGVGVYYTKGQTVMLNNQTYLVAYQTQPRVLNIANLMQMMKSAMQTSKPPAPQVLTPQTPLTLSLLNLGTVGSLTDIQPFNLATELADSRAAVQAYNDMLGSLESLGMSAMMAKPPTLPTPYHAPLKRKAPAS
jgi:hypothetical protein